MMPAPASLLGPSRADTGDSLGPRPRTAPTPELWSPVTESNHSRITGHEESAGVILIGNASSPSRKRQRAFKSRADVTYPRKRATAACHLCRARKKKCNNVRPACSSCVAAQATCVYGDSQDKSAFDPASILILDRLDQVLSILSHSNTSGQAPSASTVTAPGSQTSKYQVGVIPWQSQLNIPARRATADTILQWPVLKDRYPDSHLTDAVFAAEVFDAGSDLELSTLHQPLASTTRGNGIIEDAIPSLIQKFLDLVHIKNPVLDVDMILAYARRAAEVGFGWDSPSCLVLLSCALGSVAQPFGSNYTDERPRSSVEADAGQLQEGEAYYNLARRRFGFLDNGIIVPQCHFLAGVYLMYTMRPLLAWSHFHQASGSYHLYLQCQARRPYQTADDALAVRRRGQEQRLYWSCYKSECELRSELDLPHSSLADLEYPDMYPSPPNLSAADGISEKQEQSWFYYLTEITLRRISNRVFNTLYASDYRFWDEETLPSMIRAANDFDEQLQEWYSSVPEPIRFSEDAFHAEELPYMVQLRFFSLQFLVYQPFLYYAIHHPGHAQHQLTVQPLAEQALSTCLRAVHDHNFQHRHHGSWLYTRWVITAALTIIACAASHTVLTPSNWKDSVCSLIERLRYWEREGPGVARAVQILEDLLSMSPNPGHYVGQDLFREPQVGLA